MQVPSAGGALYFLSFRDDYSDFRVVNFIKQKSEAAECLKNFVALLHSQTGQLVATIRSDNGGEYASSDLQSWIKKGYSARNNRSLHPPAERRVRTRQPDHCRGSSYVTLF